MASRALLTWRVENAVSKDEADVYVFDVIGDPWDGVSSADFAKELRGINAKRINIHINSPGGFVSDSLAMFTAVQSHPAETHAYIVGSADSAASFLVQAADQRLTVGSTGIPFDKSVSIFVRKLVNRFKGQGIDCEARIRR